MSVVAVETLLTPVHNFLTRQTPDAWITWALENVELLLIDHANCEKKAASTAINLIYRYVDRYPLLHKMSRLAREELRHFEQVIAIMEKRSIAYQQITASDYAAGLHKHARRGEPYRLVDTLIIGAIIEARSCERFGRLTPHLDSELSKFYSSLLASESRHFQDYLTLAYSVEGQDVDSRLPTFLALDDELIHSSSAEFRFHSGLRR